MGEAEETLSRFRIRYLNLSGLWATRMVSYLLDTWPLG